MKYMSKFLMKISGWVAFSIKPGQMDFFVRIYCTIVKYLFFGCIQLSLIKIRVTQPANWITVRPKNGKKWYENEPDKKMM